MKMNKNENGVEDKSVKNKLYEKQLTPNLCKETQKDRVLFISNIRLESFYKNETALKNLISEANNINILKINKFEVNNYHRRKYIKIFLDSKEMQKSILSKANIKLDQVIYPSEAPHSINVATQPHRHSQTPENRINR